MICYKMIDYFMHPEPFWLKRAEDVNAVRRPARDRHHDDPPPRCATTSHRIGESGPGGLRERRNLQARARHGHGHHNRNQQSRRDFETSALRRCRTFRH